MIKLKKLIIIICAVFLVSIVFTIDGFAASGSGTFGFSPNGISRGNAMAAVVNDWSSVFYNMSGLGKSPAGQPQQAVQPAASSKKNILEEKAEETAVTEVTSDELGLAYFYIYPQFEIDSPKETKMDEDLQNSLITLGIVFDLFHLINFREAVNMILPGLYKKTAGLFSTVRMGVGIQLPGDGKLLKLSDLDRRTYNFMNYGRETQGLTILAGLGVGFYKDLIGFGAGVNGAASGAAGARMSKLQVVSGTQIPSYEMKMDMTPAGGPAAGMYISIGKILKEFAKLNNVYTENINFGLNYRGEVYTEISPFVAAAELETAGIDLGMELGIMGFYNPDIYTAGLGYTIPLPVPIAMLKNMTGTFTFDVEYQKWSGYREGSYREFWWNREGYSIPEFNDIIVYKFGFSLNINEKLACSAGFYNQPYYVPGSANKGIWNYLDNRKHVYSLGLQYILSPNRIQVNPVYIDLGLQIQQLVARDVVKNREYNSLVEDYAVGEGLDTSIPAEQQQAIDGYWNTWNPNYSYGGICYLATLGATIKM